MSSPLPLQSSPMATAQPSSVFVRCEHWKLGPNPWHHIHTTAKSSTTSHNPASIWLRRSQQRSITTLWQGKGGGVFFPRLSLTAARIAQFSAPQMTWHPIDTHNVSPDLSYLWAVSWKCSHIKYVSTTSLPKAVHHILKASFMAQNSLNNQSALCRHTIVLW